MGEGRVVPAPWEPFYAECPCGRYATAYAWERERIQNPIDFPMYLALFPEMENPTDKAISRANWQILCAKNEPSHVTQRLMIAEALELWEAAEEGWLKEIVERCASLGMDASADFVRERVLGKLNVLKHAASTDETSDLRPDVVAADRRGGFDKELLEMDGWSPDPSTIILPVERTNEILMMNLQKIALLRGRKPAGIVKWEEVTLAYVSDGDVIFDIRDKPPLVVAGYERPDEALKTVQGYHRTATERILQGVAAQLTRITP